MSKILSFLLPLRPALPEVFGCKDYQDQEALLRSMDHVLRVSGVEAAFLRESVEVFEAEAVRQVQSGQKGKHGARARQVFLENSSRALRCTILLRLTGKSYRGLSLQLGMSVGGCDMREGLHAFSDRLGAAA